MSSRSFQRRSEIDIPLKELNDWHFRPGAFSRLNPPWEKASVVKVPDSLEGGARAIIKVGAPPLQFNWIAEHHLIEDGFLDRQLSGPFAKWEHRHHFTESEAGTSSTLTDDITYKLPFGFPGALFGGPIIKPKLNRMFRYRHDVTKSDLERRAENPPPKSLTVLITGSTGMIGKALSGYLQTQGHRVIGITRNPQSNEDIAWDPDNGVLDIPASVDPDAVIHLAGENVATGRWNEKKRAAILESRTKGTKLIVEAVLKLKTPPSVFITASGLSGYLQTQGHRVIGITRNPQSNEDIAWDPDNGVLDIPASVDPDAVIHLAGENVATGRWNEKKRAAILESRTKGTKLIVEAVLKLKTPPSVFITASGSGYYQLGGERKNESSPAGDHFLSDVCQKWEAETAPLPNVGIRTIQARIGAVLSPAGGALQKMLPLFQLGLGGKMGSGNQRMAWISLDDVIDILHRALYEDSWEGPINLVAPEETTNKAFTKTMATVLKRPTFFPVPAFLINTVFGEMGRETVLADVAVTPQKLINLGYQFRHPDLQSALRHVMGRY